MGVLENVQVHRLENGITLLGERLPEVSSAAFSILVPVGAAFDPQDCKGASWVLTEMFNKGAGPWNSRELTAQLEDIGAQCGHSSGIEASLFSGAVLDEHFEKVLSIYAKILREPHLPPDELDAVKQLALQELMALNDSPSHKVMVELASRYYPEPFGRCHLGTSAGVRNLTPEALSSYYQEQFVPSNVVIAVAGSFDWERVKGVVEKCFGTWSGSKELLSVKPLAAESTSSHLQEDTSQLQIALAYPSVSLEHQETYAASTAVGVLSGGMHGRLFVEVREKRGLVYSVSASYRPHRGRSGVFAYAGTTPENAEETLAVMLGELRGLKNGVSEQELQRSKVDLKSKTIMRLESSSVIASQLVNDWWNLKKVRSLRDIKAGIEDVSADDIVSHLNDYPVSPITLVTLGSKKLELPQ